MEGHRDPPDDENFPRNLWSAIEANLQTTLALQQVNQTRRNMGADPEFCDRMAASLAATRHNLERTLADREQRRNQQQAAAAAPAAAAGGAVFTQRPGGLQPMHVRLYPYMAYTLELPPLPGWQPFLVPLMRTHWDGKVRVIFQHLGYLYIYSEERVDHALACASVEEANWALASLWAPQTLSRVPVMDPATHLQMGYVLVELLGPAGERILSFYLREDTIPVSQFTGNLLLFGVEYQAQGPHYIKVNI